METQTKKRLSRWSPEPLRLGGKAVRSTLLESDIPLLVLFTRYRELRADFIAALLKRPVASVSKRCSKLAHTGILRKNPEQLKQPNTNYRYQIYSLGETGKTALRHRQLWNDGIEQFGDDKLFVHTVMANDTLASIEIGACASGYRMVWFDDIAKKRDKTTDRTIPVNVSYDFGGRRDAIEFNYTNDARGPFGIDYGGVFNFFNFEAENQGEVARNNLRQPSFLKKFLALKHIRDNELYKAHWGIPRLLSLVVCPDQHSIDRRIALINKETGGKGASYILFKELPSIHDPFRVMKAGTDFFSAPWQRAGHPDFYINKKGGE